MEWLWLTPIPAIVGAVNYQETEYWIDQLFPGTMDVWELQASLPSSGRRAKPELGEPFSIAVFRQPAPSAQDEPAKLADFEAAAAAKANEHGDDMGPDGQTVCCTLDMSRFDATLRSDSGQDVRAELFLAGYEIFPIADIVATAATVITESGGMIHPVPGTLLPEVVTYTVDDMEQEGERVSVDMTTPHGLLIVPYVWPQGTPMITETQGDLHLHDNDHGLHEDVPAPTNGRVTTLIQLITITDEELEFAQDHGVMDLMKALSEAGADVQDLGRASVVSRSRR